MKINCFSATFWFNIFTDHTNVLKDFNAELKDEYDNFTIASESSNNLLVPVITAYNEKKHSNLMFSQINLQYTVEDTTMENFNEFKEKTLKIFEILDTNNIAVLHSSIFINGEKYQDEAILNITDKLLNKKVVSDDLVDASIKLAKKCDDQFYKFVSLSNKKQLQFPKEVDDKGRLIPIPLIPWQNSVSEQDLIEVIYEINDKCSFDFTKNYQTSEFYLNKMLYILETDFLSDIETLITKGEF